MFAQHQNLSDHINGNIIRSEIEGGVDLRQLPPKSMLRVETRNREYTIVMQRDCNALISGHPQFCPEPVLVRIHGSNWGGSMIKTAYLGRGMHLEFRHPMFEGLIVTSPICDIQLLPQAA
ncbi:MAG TPA: hypothetical protein VLM42_15250 [Bryobacteraceae bacterium]|jgi:hypothetical protein|nr:hypothetical protein [Bryobacteraceae bacterium]